MKVGLVSDFLVYPMIRYSTIPEIVLGTIPELNIPEMSVSYIRNNQVNYGKISSSEETAGIIREIFPNGKSGDIL